MNDEILTIHFRDGQSISIPVAAVQGEFLLALVEGTFDGDNVVATPRVAELPERFGVPEIRKIVEFCTMVQADPMVEIRDPRSETLLNTFEENVPQKAYQTYVQEMEIDLFFKVRSAANFLGIEQLVYLVNVWLAYHVKDKSVTEIQEIFGLPPLTAAEEAEARQNHPWLFDDPDAAVEQAVE